MIAGWPGEVFWHTFRPALNDDLNSVLFNLGHFTRNAGAPTLWAQLLAGEGRGAPLAQSVGMLHMDLEAIAGRQPLFCFDEMDLLQSYWNPCVVSSRCCWSGSGCTWTPMRIMLWNRCRRPGAPRCCGDWVWNRIRERYIASSNLPGAIRACWNYMRRCITAVMRPTTCCACRKSRRPSRFLTACGGG